VQDTWATENIHVIRTLMERATLYRRALAPVSLTTGGLGILGGLGGWGLGLDSARSFTGYWMSLAILVLAASLVIVRRQALGAHEAFWSPPTRRVAQAMVPPLFGGLVAGLVVALPDWRDPLHAWWLPGIWMILFGCAAHAAGFFMPRGMKLFGGAFALLGAALVLAVNSRTHAAGLPPLALAHLVMGATFGGLHVAYGIYLALTEKRTPGV